MVKLKSQQCTILKAAVNDASYHGLLVHRDYEAKTVKAKVLKVKFQNLGENGAEAHFKWEPKSGSFLPAPDSAAVDEPMPWE